MPISNRTTPHVANKISKFTSGEQRIINNALDELERDTLASNYKCTRQSIMHSDTSRTIEVGANGIRIDYKFDIGGLVTIIDIYRSRWHPIKVLLDFSP